MKLKIILILGILLILPMVSASIRLIKIDDIYYENSDLDKQKVIYNYTENSIKFFADYDGGKIKIHVDYNITHVTGHSCLKIIYANSNICTKTKNAKWECLENFPIIIYKLNDKADILARGYFTLQDVEVKQ